MRVSIIQPSLAKYRVPVFALLAQRKDIELKVMYGETLNIPNVAPQGFVGIHSPMTAFRIGSETMLWQSAQIEYATRKHSDVLILSWDIHYLSLIPALIRAKANGVGTILWGHGYSKRERAWRSFFRRQPTYLADTLLFYSQPVADAYRKCFYRNTAAIAVAQNALDQKEIQDAREAWLSCPEKLLQFQIDQKLLASQSILFCSRLEESNRVDLLLKAAAKLISQRRNLQVIVIGTGPAEDSLRCLACDLGINQNVRFVGGIYHQMDLAPWFLSSTVFCYPENIGLSLLHAFGYGLAVITSDKIEAHNPEIAALRPGENGLLYRHGDLDDLEKCLRQALTNVANCMEMGKTALKTVLEDFTLEHMVDGFEHAILASYRKKVNKDDY